MTDFSNKVLKWFDQHGRKNLPWQLNINPYRVWVSEIMLQQTQVKTVIPYYNKFMQSFPDVQTLADANQDSVLKHWSGLGYYARARNLHKAAKQVSHDFDGNFPQTLDEMQSLSGIGRSTAAAILSISHNQAEAILDGNVKRVLCRVYAVEGWPGKSLVLKQLWKLAENVLPKKRNADYSQAMMDLGATLCTRSKPQCCNCPLKSDCLALKQQRQMDFPEKKPKKALPEKNTVMLIIKNKEQAIFMQKRPPTGIWGSLWCFPQFDNKEQASEWLQQQYNESLESADSLATLSHTFSHFRLHIHPLIIESKAPINLGVMENKDSLWYNVTTEFNGGLAAPVTKLIDILKGFENGTNG